MKKQLLVMILVIMSCAYACNMIYFVEPQPSNGTVLTEFPAELQGSWTGEIFTESDKDTVVINSNSIIAIQITDKELSYEEVDTGQMYWIDNGLIYSEKWEKADGFSYNHKGDSIVFTIVQTESFDLSDSLILISSGSNYCINFLAEDANWMPISITKNTAGDISFNYLSFNNDLEIMEKQLKQKVDSVGNSDYIFTKSLNNRKFDQVLKDGSFSEELILLKEEQRLK